MKKHIITVLIVALVATAAYAQSTANQIQLGFLTTTGCPNGQTSCWKPYSAANPMPTILSR